MCAPVCAYVTFYPSVPGPEEQQAEPIQTQETRWGELVDQWKQFIKQLSAE